MELGRCHVCGRGASAVCGDCRGVFFCSAGCDDAAKTRPGAGRRALHGRRACRFLGRVVSAPFREAFCESVLVPERIAVGVAECEAIAIAIEESERTAISLALVNPLGKPISAN